MKSFYVFGMRTKLIGEVRVILYIRTHKYTLFFCFVFWIDDIYEKKSNVVGYPYCNTSIHLHHAILLQYKEIVLLHTKDYQNHNHYYNLIDFFHDKSKNLHIRKVLNIEKENTKKIVLKKYFETILIFISCYKA